MSESIRNETQLGLAELTKRFSAAGIAIAETQRPWPNRSANFLLIGKSEHHTSIMISDEFLDDLPNTKEYQAVVDSYACAVAGRLKCGSPELFYCQSGVPVRVSIQWPIHTVWANSSVSNLLLTGVTNQLDAQVAQCSMEVRLTLGYTIFDIVIEAVNGVRKAIDDGLVSFCSPDVRRETYPRIKRQQPAKRRSQAEIEQFLREKAYVLGFLAADELGEVWAADPWDAQYLGVTRKELLLAMRVLRANGLFDPGSGPEYALPTDKLLAEQSSPKEREDTLFQSQQTVSRSKLPNKEELIRDTRTVLERHSVSTLLVIDLDNFKSVNDTKGHSEGDDCLDRVVKTIGNVIGRKGKIYRWGGDEFAIWLPDFSTEEAQVTAERIRCEVERAKPGGDIAVTASIGICGSDRTDSKSAEEILDFADKAMYESKRLGKNRVTVWLEVPK